MVGLHFVEKRHMNIGLRCRFYFLTSIIRGCDYNEPIMRFGTRAFVSYLSHSYGMPESSGLRRRICPSLSPEADALPALSINA